MLRTILRPFARLARDCRGGIAVSFAIAAPAILCVTGVAVDYANMSYMKTGLQTVADAAALAGAQELALPNVKTSQVEAAVSSVVELHAGGATVGRAVNTQIKTAEVTVDLERSWTPFFVHLLDSNVTPVRAHAKAKLLYGATKVCVLTLRPTEAGAVRVTREAVITANDCGIYSNSTDAEGIQVDRNAIIRAKMICSAGGVLLARTGNATPAPITDCPPLDDPLKNRPPPDSAGCDFNGFKVAAGNRTLAPGIYCGGLEISGTANVRFGAGTYIIKNGRLRIANTATAEGEDIGFYLTGTNALIDFSGDSTIRLSGPETGAMAGLLFFEDRSATLVTQHRISSTNADKLVGTIYLPRGQLRVDPNALVADQSAYTAIIVYELRLDLGPELVLNADYDGTDVPVPDGIKTSKTVVLAE